MMKTSFLSPRPLEKQAPFSPIAGAWKMLGGIKEDHGKEN